MKFLNFIQFISVLTIGILWGCYISYIIHKLIKRDYTYKREFIFDICIPFRSVIKKIARRFKELK